MNEPFYLDQRGTTILVGVFLALMGLVFVAGWITGVLIGWPGGGASADAPTPPPTAPSAVTVKVVPPPPPPAETDTPDQPPVQETEAAEPVATTEDQETTPETEATPAPETAESEETAAPLVKPYTVQVGSFRKRENAEKLARALEAKGYETAIKAVTLADGQDWYAVRIGFSDTLSAAREVAARYTAEEGGKPLVIRTALPVGDSDL